jgi:transposase
VVRIKDEHDLETLRQIALLQDNENKRLVERVTQLTVENLRLRGFEETEQLELEIRRNLEAAREEILRIDERKNKSTAATSTTKRAGHGPRPQPELPTVERVMELPVTERKCSVCDGELGEMSGQFEESEVVTVVKRSFVIEKHRRKKYRCRCNANVVTAPAAPKLQPGGRYSVEFGVEVAVNKYLDHLPLERQSRMMRREGLAIDSQTLWDQLNVLARHLEPVYDALGDKVLQSPVLHADETRWPLSL